MLRPPMGFKYFPTLTATVAQATTTTAAAKYANFGGLYVDNTANAAKTYIQLFIAAAASDITLGTTPPTMTYVVPNNSTINFQMDPCLLFTNSQGISGIFIAATTTPTGLTAPVTAVSATVYFEEK